MSKPAEITSLLHRNFMRVMSLGSFGKIAICWGVITFVGVSGFILSKNSVDKRRYQDMQIRERMRKSNTGEYEKVGDRSFTG
ncbi:uncharacterized protein LOC105210943 [Zeugodacus cucurbitae]|uniref:uncharacterized protein LOC105210943 n=1 Tax=Zeugodacus cucurbitae TaxID=28588 RepID=UPI0005968104|nr:uncharacterized protein LOC105210943 [Zeugodacus cucurbitae]